MSSKSLTTGGHDPLAVAAVALTAVAFLGSFTHVRQVVAENGQDGWLSWAIAAMPEAMVLLSVLKVRRGKGTDEPTAWAWVVGGSAAVFTIAANLATATPTAWGYVAAGWPAWAAICAAGLVDLHGPKKAVRKPAKSERPVRATTTTAPAAPAPEPVSPATSTPRPRVSDDDLMAEVARLVEAGDLAPGDVTGNRLRGALGVGAARASRIAETWQAQHRRAAVRAIN